MSKHQNDDQKQLQKQKKIVEIAPYRKKQQRRRALRRLVWFSILMVAVIGGAVIWSQLYQEGTATTAEKATWPVSLSGDTPWALHTSEQSLVVTGSGYLHLYNFDATPQNRVMHGFSNPITHTAGDYTLTYDHGGYAVRLDVDKENAKTATLSNRILFCRVADNGRVLIGTQSTKYTTELLEYDAQLKPTGFVYRMNEYIMSASFSGNSSCVVAAQRVEGASFETVLYGLNFNSEQAIFSLSLTSSMVLSVDQKVNGSIALVCTEEFFLLEKNGKNPKRYDYPAPLATFDNTFPDVTVLALTDITSPSKHDLLLFSNIPTTTEEADILVPKAQAHFPQPIRDIAVSDNSVAVLGEESIEVFNFALGRKSSYPQEGEYMGITNHHQRIFALTKNKVHQIK